MGWLDGFGAQLSAVGALPYTWQKLREIVASLKGDKKDTVKGHRVFWDEKQ